MSDLARQMKRSYRATLKLFLGMARKDAEAGMRADECWLIDGGKYSRKLVNVQRLRARHPALFERRYVSREEHDDVVTTNAEMRRQLHTLTQKVNGLAARLRKVEGR